MPRETYARLYPWVACMDCRVSVNISDALYSLFVRQHCACPYPHGLQRFGSDTFDAESCPPAFTAMDRLAVAGRE